MPGKDGLDITQVLKQIAPDLHGAGFLTIYPEEQYAVRLLKAGASGYINKRE
jgi:DNA-binding NarL/FixJ family response regulator